MLASPAPQPAPLRWSTVSVLALLAPCSPEKAWRALWKLMHHPPIPFFFFLACSRPCHHQRFCLLSASCWWADHHHWHQLWGRCNSHCGRCSLQCRGHTHSHLPHMHGARTVCWPAAYRGDAEHRAQRGLQRPLPGCVCVACSGSRLHGLLFVVLQCSCPVVGLHSI